MPNHQQAVLEKVPMPKKKREDVTVKIEASVYRQAKRVVAYRNITLAEYLSDILRRPVAHDYEKTLRKEISELGSEEAE